MNKQRKLTNKGQWCHSTEKRTWIEEGRVRELSPSHAPGETAGWRREDWGTWTPTLDGRPWHLMTRSAPPVLVFWKDLRRFGARKQKPEGTGSGPGPVDQLARQPTDCRSTGSTCSLARSHSGPPGKTHPSPCNSHLSWEHHFSS